MMQSYWSEEEIRLLKEFYPLNGLMKTAKILNRSFRSVRNKASVLKVKQDRSSDFFKDWQKRAAKSKIGKKRPKHSNFMKKFLKKNGNPASLDYVKEKISKKAKERILLNGHPKGFKDKKHSDSAKRKISKKSKRMWKNKTEDQMFEIRKRSTIMGYKYSAANRNGKTTWKSGWREIGNEKKYYRSRWEANFARYLELLLKQGNIKKWEHEPETFWFEGIRRGTLSYLPDFRVTELDDTFTYYEVKGWMDKRSETKLKRMKKYHPRIKLILIRLKEYNALKLKVSSIIKDWEN